MDTCQVDTSPQVVPSSSPQVVPHVLQYTATSHHRILPTPHAFRYSLFHLLLDVDALDRGETGSFLFAVVKSSSPSSSSPSPSPSPSKSPSSSSSQGSSWASWAWAPVQLREDDYLKPAPAPGFRARALHTLASLSSIPAEDIGPIKLWTLPRVLGAAFNPLSVWFLYTPAGSLRCTLAEVNNTFGEKYVYVLDHHHRAVDPEPPVPVRAGYQFADVKERLFHVSPFNPRNGLYGFQVRAPSVDGVGKTDVAIVYWAPKGEGVSPSRTTRDDDKDTPTIHQTSSKDTPTIHQTSSKDAPTIHQTSSPTSDDDGTPPASPSTSSLPPKSSYPSLQSHFHKSLHARLHSLSSYPLSTSTLLRALLSMPLTAFLTVPRILWEAGKLHYLRKLGVWGRPAPLAGGRGRGSGMVRWIGVEEEEGGVRGWLEERGVEVRADWEETTSEAEAREQATGEKVKQATGAKVTLRLHAPELLTDLQLRARTGRNPLEPWMVSYVRGDYSTDLPALLNVLHMHHTDTAAEAAAPRPLHASPSSRPSLASRLIGSLWPSRSPLPNLQIIEPPALPTPALLAAAYTDLVSRIQLDALFATNWTLDTSSRAVFGRCLGYADNLPLGGGGEWELKVRGEERARFEEFGRAVEEVRRRVG